MMEPRRKFLQKMGLMAGAFSAASLFEQAHAAEWEQASRRISHMSAGEAAMDEDFWMTIQQAYTVNSNLIILNNGGVSPSPRVVQDAVERYNRCLLYTSPSPRD